jgi:probable HAF family extracellular repeat protein
VGFTAVPGVFGIDWDQRACCYRAGRIEELPTLGGKYSVCADINEAGLMVGWSTTAAGEHHACLWKAGVVYHLGTLEGKWSEAEGINKKGDIVGTADRASGRLAACLWRNGKAVELARLLSPASGSALYTAKRINDRGQIIGEGGPGGQHASYLLTPTR